MQSTYILTHRIFLHQTTIGKISPDGINRIGTDNIYQKDMCLRPQTNEHPKHIAGNTPNKKNMAEPVSLINIGDK